MSAADCAVWFLGDLEDPWVAALADALPRDVHRTACAGDLPDDLAEKASAAPPRTVVVHRALLTPRDAAALARLRGRVTPAPKLVLCVGPHVRHADVEQWMARGLIDALVPEATARDTIARHLVAEPSDAQARRPAGPRPRVTVVSGNFELRLTLADACQALGYPVETAPDWPEAASSGPALWDVPVLEPGWSDAIARRARSGPVVVLLGFADRTSVVQAREHGASACLELPCDLFDLAHVLDRLSSPRGDLGHAVPPPAASSRRRKRSNVSRAGPES